METTVHRFSEVWGMTARIPTLLATAATFALAACAADADPSAAGPDVVVETIGDTTVVRTLSGGVWEDEATLVPEVSIGELDGSEEYLFGRIGAIAVDDDHNMYVLDEQARHVRVFDSAGSHVQTLGGRGEGPGEFQVPIGIAISERRVLVRDPANGRVQLFRPETWDNEEWKYQPSPYFWSTPLYTDDQGRIYVDISEDDPRFIVMGPDGTHLDTVSAPDAPSGFDDGDYVVTFRGENASGGWISIAKDIPFSPGWYWTVHPTGRFLTALSTAYRIDLEQDIGVLRIERDHMPVAVADDEHDHHERKIVRAMRRFDADWTWNGPPIPGHKPFFHELLAGRDGRIWVRLATEANPVENEDHDPEDPSSMPVDWREPLRYDVFEPDGTYLGVVAPPKDFTRWVEPVFDGDYVWAVTRDELGIQRVVRFRIVVGGG